MLRKPSHDEIMAAIEAAYNAGPESSIADIASMAASDILDLMTTPKKKLIKVKG